MVDEKVCKQEVRESNKEKYISKNKCDKKGALVKYIQERGTEKVIMEISKKMKGRQKHDNRINKEDIKYANINHNKQHRNN